MSKKIYFYICSIFFFTATSVSAQRLIGLELQAYHSLGNRGSSYSTLSGGMNIKIKKQQMGPLRNLQILGLYIPDEIFSLGTKIGGWNTDSPGIGFEIGIIDTHFMTFYSKGANVSYRHINWKKTHSGKNNGQMTANIIHAGWNWGKTVLYFLGFDIAILNTPREQIHEIQGALGARMFY